MRTSDAAGAVARRARSLAAALRRRRPPMPACSTTTRRARRSSTCARSSSRATSRRARARPSRSRSRRAARPAEAQPARPQRPARAACAPTTPGCAARTSSSRATWPSCSASRRTSQQGVDDRIRKLEPQKVTVDGREFLADPRREAPVRRGAGGVPARRVRPRGERRSPASCGAIPTSGYRESALFWLGNAQYGKRDYKEAITTFRTLVTRGAATPAGARGDARDRQLPGRAEGRARRARAHDRRAGQGVPEVGSGAGRPRAPGVAAGEAPRERGCAAARRATAEPISSAASAACAACTATPATRACAPRAWRWSALGGVGSWAAEALARSGVARADADRPRPRGRVEHQPPGAGARRARSARPRSQALRERIADIHPGCEVHARRGVRRRTSNWPALLPAAGRRADRRLRPGARQGGAGRLGAGDGHAAGRVGAAGGKRAAAGGGGRRPRGGHPRSAARRAAPAPAQAPRRGRAQRPLRRRAACSRARRCVPPAGRRDDGCDVDGSLNCHGYGSSVAVTATFGMVAAARALEFAVARRRAATGPSRHRYNHGLWTGC